MAALDPLADETCLHLACDLLEGKESVLAPFVVAPPLGEDGSSELSASTLVEAAAWALTSRSPEGLEIAIVSLERARVLLVEMVVEMSHLKDQSDAEREKALMDRFGRSFRRLADLEVGLEEQAAEIDAQTRLAEALREALKSLPDGERPDWFALCAGFTGFSLSPDSRRVPILLQKAEPLLLECLRDGDLPRMKTILLALGRQSSRTRDEQVKEIQALSAEDMEQLSHMMTIDPELFDLSDDDVAGTLLRGPASAVSRMRDLTTRRQVGVPLDKQHPSSLLVSDWRRRLPVADDAASARAQARGLIRAPRLYGRLRGPRGICATVAVSPKALQELIDEDPGLDLVASRIRLARGEVKADCPSPALPHLGVHGLYAVARKRGVVSGSRLEVRYICEIDTTARRAPETLSAQALSSPHWPKGRPCEPERVEFDEKNGIASVRSPSTAGPPLSSPQMSLEALVGPDRCDHPGATWALSRGGPVMDHDTADLSCPRCLRQRLAVAPLHRMSPEWVAEHVPRGVDEKTYLRIERVHAQISGDARPVESFDQLRQRDGLVPLDPSAYASEGTDETAPARPRTVAGAMNRR